ncbi:MAG: hypothetical protein HQK84_12630 [Nitrospinae bacterium]|nr:hypothetical protein [Nitrospinota bacterium]
MTKCPHCLVEIKIFPEHAQEDYLRCEDCENFFEITSLNPIVLQKLFIEECQDCFEDIFIPEGAKVGDIVECIECKKTYEIIKNEPHISLFPHPLVLVNSDE